MGGSPFGPWVVATAVPPVIYSIPTASPIHYVTYVRIYRYSPTVVWVGLHARIPRHLLLAVGHGRLRHGLELPALDRPLLVRRADDVGLRGRHQLESVERLERGLRLGRLSSDLPARTGARTTAGTVRRPGTVRRATGPVYPAPDAVRTSSRREHHERQRLQPTRHRAARRETGRAAGAASPRCGRERGRPRERRRARPGRRRDRRRAATNPSNPSTRRPRRRRRRTRSTRPATRPAPRGPTTSTPATTATSTVRSPAAADGKRTTRASGSPCSPRPARRRSRRRPGPAPRRSRSRSNRRPVRRRSRAGPPSIRARSISSRAIRRAATSATTARARRPSSRPAPPPQSRPAPQPKPPQPKKPN